MFEVNDVAIPMKSAVFGSITDTNGTVHRIRVYLSSEPDVCARLTAEANGNTSLGAGGLVPVRAKTSETLVTGSFATSASSQWAAPYTLEYPASLLNGPAIPHSGAFFDATNTFQVLGNHVEHDRWDYGQVNADGSIQVYYTSDSNQLLTTFPDGNSAGQAIAAEAQLQAHNVFFLSGHLSLSALPTANMQQLAIVFDATGKSPHNVGAVSGTIMATACHAADSQVSP